MRRWTGAWLVGGVVVLLAVLVGGCAGQGPNAAARQARGVAARATAGVRTRRPGSVAAPAGPLWTLSDRGIKTELIMRLKKAPGVVIVGGSRALRFQPGWITRLTGFTAFNAAVPHATPQDEWCFVNLFHQRFPKARFALLWVIHCDEFDEYTPGATLLEDPFLSRFLPDAFVRGQLDHLSPAAHTALVQGALHPSVIAPDGYTVSDGISIMAAQRTLRQGVDAWIGQTLRFYRTTPPRIDAAPAYYFTMTLRLMNDLGVEPTIVLAPLQPRYLAAIYHHGWEARHRLVLAYLRRLRRRYGFRVLDFSRLSSIGGSPTGFYDAVHLRPATTRLVVRAVLRARPHAFALPRAVRA